MKMTAGTQALRRPSHAWIAVVATILAVAASLGPVSAPIARAATDSLSITTSATYTVVPARKLVRTVVDVTARNDKPNQTSGGVVTRYFYDSFRIGIQPESTAIKATSGGETLSTTTKAFDGFIQLEVRFPSSLFYGQTAKVRVTFDLPGGAPRSKSEVRVGPAFVTFVAWAFGDSGSVRIIVPAGFDAETSGSDVTRSTASGGATVFRATGITDVPSWYVIVNADRKSALTNARIDLAGGEHLVIHAWPDDPEWKKQVTDLLTRGLPELVDETGLSWPVSGDLDVFEVHTPLLEGYAGVFFEGQNRIEISEDLDDLTILHESSHAWFNGDLFDGRWINEGFADTFASRSLDAIGLGGFVPGTVHPTDKAAVKLNDWVFPGRIVDDETDAREQFGYDAAWTVVRSIATEVGPDKMRDVLAAAENHQIAYVGAGTPETVAGRTDWRRLLDLLDERGHSRTADELFRRWVVNEADTELLDQRIAARTNYASLLEESGDWLPPMYVRDSLAGWRFDEAAARIDKARDVIAKRDELAAIAGRLGVAPPTDGRTAYQTATDSLDAAGALVDREIQDGRLAEAAAAAVAAPRDTVEMVGLMGTTPAAQLEAVRAAFSSGATTTATDAAALSALMAGAADVGRDRLIAAAVVVLVAIALLVLLILVVRARRRRRSFVGPVPVAVPAAAMAAMPALPRVMMAHPGAPTATASVPAPGAGPAVSAVPPPLPARRAMAHPVAPLTADDASPEGDAVRPDVDAGTARPAGGAAARVGAAEAVPSASEVPTATTKPRRGRRAKGTQGGADPDAPGKAVAGPEGTTPEPVAREPYATLAHQSTTADETIVIPAEPTPGPDGPPAAQGDAS